METARDTALEYIETGIGTRPSHKFEHFAMGSADYAALPQATGNKHQLRYMLKVYVDD
jgi:hypothetical protein